jgi:hypothetical protein
MVLSTVYLFVIFLLAGLAEFCTVVFPVYLVVFFLLAGAGKKNDKHINSGQHRDILSQLRPEEKRQTNKQWTTP